MERRASSPLRRFVAMQQSVDVLSVEECGRERPHDCRREPCDGNCTQGWPHPAECLAGRCSTGGMFARMLLQGRGPTSVGPESSLCRAASVAEVCSYDLRGRSTSSPQALKRARTIRDFRGTSELVPFPFLPPVVSEWGRSPIYFFGKFGSFLISRICWMWRSAWVEISSIHCQQSISSRSPKLWARMSSFVVLM